MLYVYLLGVLVVELVGVSEEVGPVLCLPAQRRVQLQLRHPVPAAVRVSNTQYCGTKYHSPGPQQVVPVQQLRDKPGVPPARLVLLTHAGETKIFDRDRKIFDRYFIQC